MPASIPYQAGPKPTVEETQAFLRSFTYKERFFLNRNDKYLRLEFSDLDKAMEYAEKLLEKK